MLRTPLGLLALAADRLQAETAWAHAQLNKDAATLGVAVAERVLGRKIPS